VSATAFTAVHRFRRRLKEAFYDAVPRGRLVRRGPSEIRRIALSFDDGPNELTEQYLDTLDRLGVPATFFVMGDLSEARPDLVREYVRRGHQIASHGYDHRRFPDLTWREVDEQLRKTDAAIGPQPTAHPWVRPPYGAMDARVVAQLFARGYTIALWSLDSNDHDDHDPASIGVRCAPEQVSPGEVLLFHEGQPWTLEALPGIVDGLRGAGYECVTMSDLFAT